MAGPPTMGPKPTAAAAVEQLCALGNDSRLGVVTRAGTSSSAGRARRTTRLTTTPAAWAGSNPAVPGDPGGEGVPPPGGAGAPVLPAAATQRAGGAEGQPAERVLAEVGHRLGD